MQHPDTLLLVSMVQYLQLRHRVYMLLRASLSHEYMKVERITKTVQGKEHKEEEIIIK